VKINLLPDYYQFFPNFHKEELGNRLSNLPFHLATLLGLKNINLAIEMVGKEYLQNFLASPIDVQRALLIDMLHYVGIQPKVANAAAALPREKFVSQDFQKFAYINHFIPFSDGSCASPPGLTALMIERLQPQNGDRILDVGFGCGLHSAWISELVKNECEIIGIESHKPFGCFGRDVVRNLGYRNIHVHIGDGLASAEWGCFSKVLITFAQKELNEILLDRISENGMIQFVRALNKDEFLSEEPDSWLRSNFCSYSEYLQGDWRSYCVIETSRRISSKLVVESKVFDVTFVPTRFDVTEERTSVLNPFLALQSM
jgi:protein-L-isoaspartate(D-aspartate) O-methyltransferase